MRLPKYIDCKKNTETCEYFITRDCKNTCPYAREIGVGASDTETARKIRKNIDELFKEDMRDY